MATPCENANLILVDNGHSLWLGNIESPQDKTFLTRNNISVIFNITRKDYPQYPGLRYYQVTLSDSDTPREMKRFLEVAEHTGDIIHQELRNNNVLIHCEMGMQRSAAIVAAYIMKYYKLSPDQAVEFVKSKRSLAFKTRVTFLEALYRLYQLHQSQQNITQTLTAPSINISRITTERSRPGGSYTVAELRNIAVNLGLSKSGDKKNLVDRILAKLHK